jgi:predicted transcriptional regulator
MSHTAREIPPPLELLCLKALWSLREGNVKDVQRIVAQSRPLAYTTIMTVLDRLMRKGKLARRKVGRAFQYAPTESRDSMRQAAIRELLEGFFDGSRQELLEFLSDAPRQPAAPPVRPAAPESENRIDTVLL